MTTATIRTVLPHNLAACYQEMFSLAAQISTGKEIGDPDRFRNNVRTLVRQSDAAAKSLGYGGEDVSNARFAVVALLDDIILNSNAGTFLNWADNPLAIELFQKGGAGVRFFSYLDELLRRSEDPRTLDLLEVYAICLLLGFRGQYGRNNDGQLYAWREPALEKLNRVARKGRVAVMAPDWQQQLAIQVPPPPEYYSRRAMSATLVTVALVPLLFLGYWLLLRVGMADLNQLSGR